MYLSGRTAALLAVIIQAAGKVIYGTWLSHIPASLFVLVSFALTAIVCILYADRSHGKPCFLLFLLLNIATTVTFFAYFYALQYIEPAIVGALNVGSAPMFALIFALLLVGLRPDRVQIMTCAGILCGCIALFYSAFEGEGVVTGRTAINGVIASLVAGAGAVIIAMLTKSLMQSGWSRSAILAHRFYLIVPVALFFTVSTGIDTGVLSMPVVVVILVFALGAIIIPLFLLQIAIERTDTYTFIITMSALPVFTFLFEAFSPAYRLSSLTAVGVTIISATLIMSTRATNTQAQASR